MKRALLIVVMACGLGLSACGGSGGGGSSSPTTGNYTPAPAPTSTTAAPPTTAPVTTTTGSGYVTTFSAACNAALAPARAILKKAANKEQITAAEVGAIQSSAAAGSKACTPQEYISFQTLELGPYLKPAS